MMDVSNKIQEIEDNDDLFDGNNDHGKVFLSFELQNGSEEMLIARRIIGFATRQYTLIIFRRWGMLFREFNTTDANAGTECWWVLCTCFHSLG